MNALPDAVAHKLALLIPMLGSDRIGEVQATVAAIKRTLESASLDLHDLAAAIERLPSSPSRQPSRPWQLIARTCLEHRVAFRLSEREVEFLSGMARWPTAPSEKQMAWLETIAAALGVNARAAA